MFVKHIVILWMRQRLLSLSELDDPGSRHLWKGIFRIFPANKTGFSHSRHNFSSPASWISQDASSLIVRLSNQPISIIIIFIVPFYNVVVNNVLTMSIVLYQYLTVFAGIKIEISVCYVFPSSWQNYRNLFLSQKLLRKNIQPWKRSISTMDGTSSPTLFIFNLFLE